jgi:hypothetical protein
MYDWWLAWAIVSLHLDSEALYLSLALALSLEMCSLTASNDEKLSFDKA